MIKVEVFRKEGKGTTTLIFESRDTSSEGLDKLDEAYNALLGSSPKREVTWEVTGLRSKLKI